MNAKQYKVIDGHCDTISELMQTDGDLLNSGLCVTLPGLVAYGGYIQFFALWLDDAEAVPLSHAEQMAKFYHEQIKQFKLTSVLSACDAENVLKKGQVGALLAVENGNVLEGDIQNLKKIYRWGVRALTLTWNGTNELCDGIGIENGAGLSVFGRNVVQLMNELGMIVDVSHISERGFWDVMRESKQPVMATHSNSRTICGHKRNLTDEQIRALSEKGGVLGLNLYPSFLTEEEIASWTDCIRHIKHIINIGGEDCLGLGSDFDGFSGDMPYGITGPQDFYFLFEKLKENGLTAQQIEKIAYKNVLDFTKNILK